MPPKADEEPMSALAKVKLYTAVHWKGLVIFLTPLILLFILSPFPPKNYQWTAYCLCVMAVYWVTECIPLPVTSFLPLVIFPMTGVLETGEVCRSYMNDTLFMFIGSLILAYSVEQSGLHLRLAYGMIRLIGYSHIKPRASTGDRENKRIQWEFLEPPIEGLILFMTIILGVLLFVFWNGMRK